VIPLPPKKPDDGLGFFMAVSGVLFLILLAAYLWV
jgi:hypothetical protein